MASSVVMPRCGFVSVGCSPDRRWQLVPAGVEVVSEAFDEWGFPPTNELQFQGLDMHYYTLRNPSQMDFNLYPFLRYRDVIIASGRSDLASVLMLRHEVVDLDVWVLMRPAREFVRVRMHRVSVGDPPRQLLWVDRSHLAESPDAWRTAVLASLLTIAAPALGWNEDQTET